MSRDNWIVRAGGGCSRLFSEDDYARVVQRVESTARGATRGDADHPIVVRSTTMGAPSRSSWTSLGRSAIACVVAACATPSEPAPLPPTPWEITRAASVDDGASYWPQSQWRTALPSQVGMDSAAMATLSRDVRGKRWPTLRSLLVIHRGYLVFNEYLGGAEPQKLQLIQSVTKTVTGLLVGVAVDSGEFSVTDGIWEFFPEYASLLTGMKGPITVDHFLTMRSCLNFWEEPYEGSPLQRLNNSTGDWLELIFTQSMTGSPGEKWSYNSGGIIALGGVLYSATGEPADVYARHALFGPIGISQFDWYKGQPHGLPHMGGGLSLTSPDMARIGYLLLRKGRWNDRQVVSESWIARMREHKTRQLGAWLSYSLDYGRTLWLLPPLSTGGDPDVIAASGAGGQWIIVVPGKDLVIVSTGDSDSMLDFTRAIQLTYDVIVPATH
jgi:CubicO group peptidase (beta-lactamase class C family)